ncbi:MAG TPA: pitrilysin family protein [Verrucomicrobiae bacterium]|nr:pitrilysin family protein [Verrucomicrobiae bacterium]
MRRLHALFLPAICWITAPLGAQIRLPDYTRDVLPNGAVVYLMAKPGLPLVNFRILVRGGTESEPATLAGLSSVTAELLRRGAGQRTADQFSEELDSLGGTFFAGVSDQSTTISAEFLSKDFDQGIGLAADAILHPQFPADEVRKALARRADGLKSIKDNPGALNSYYRNFFFGSGHPYGRIADEASYDRIRREDIVSYHQRLFTGRNLAVIAVGDFDPVKAKARLTSVFGAAPAGAAYAWTADNPPSAANRVLLIDKPDATQTYFIIARPGVRRSTPDRTALLLVNELFGGRFTSMLNEALRINSGLTYGASSSVQMSRLTGALYISTYTKTESTAKAIDMALDILKKLYDQGLTAAQLASAKSYVKGNYPPATVQTIDQLAGALAEIELFGLDRNEVDQFMARVDGVTLEQANDVIHRYFKPEALTFVILGNAAKIRGEVAKYGPKVEERSVTQAGWAGM